MKDWMFDKWDRDEPSWGIGFGFVRSPEEEAKEEARQAWAQAWRGIEIPVHWEFEGEKGVSIFLVDHSGITDQWGNFFCDFPDDLPAPGDIAALADFINAQPDRGEE